jgi:hypothetical protein
VSEMHYEIDATVIDTPLKHPHPMQHFVIYGLKSSLSLQSFVQSESNILLVYTPDYKYIFENQIKSKFHVL